MSAHLIACHLVAVPIADDDDEWPPDVVKVVYRPTTSTYYDTPR